MERSEMTAAGGRTFVGRLGTGRGDHHGPSGSKGEFPGIAVLVSSRAASLRTGAHSRHLQLRVVADQKCQYTGRNRTGPQHNKAEGCFTRRVFEPADGIRAGKAPETADRIDQCNAASGSRTGEKPGWEGPEGGKG